MKDFKKPRTSSRPVYSGKRSPAFGSDRSAEKHKASCNSCHKICEVPFRPNGKKPVYCRDCFKSNMPSPSFSPAFRGPETRKTEVRKDDTDTGDMKKQFSILNTKLDRLIAVIEAQTRALSSTEK